MPAQTFGLDAYLARIGYQGPRAPGYATLAGVLAAHHASIPFESFDVLLGRPIRLDPQGLQAKMVAARRGGYCFEQASLMHAALTALGFQPVRHSSRVLVFEPREVSGRQHLFLTVETEGRTYVVDPGFGPFASPRPVPLDGTPLGTHRMGREGADWILYTQRDGAEIPGWASSMEVENPVDVEMMNHYVATHPASFFMHNILASAPIAGGLVTIMNQGARILRDGAVQEVELADRRALRAMVAAHFGFDLPELETMRVGGVPGWQ